MVKMLRKKSILTAVFITGAVVMIFVLLGSSNFTTGIFKSIFSPVLTLTSGISHSVGDFKDYLIEMQVYKEENERLADEINAIKKENKDVSELKSENDRLYELLDLKSSLEYSTVAARVISYEPNNWYDTLVINKGRNDGVKAGDAVICPQGIVGKVTDSGLGWAKIASVLNDETAVGVRIIRTGALAIVEGDPDLARDKCCRLSFFDKGADMSVGDILETTGAGGVYPEGVAVGTVVRIQNNNDGGEYAVIEPAADVENLYEILVVTGASEE